MIEAALISLAQIVLPSEVLSSFDITKVESTDTHIYLKNDFLDEGDQYETPRSDSFQGTEDAIVRGSDLRHI